MAAWGIGSRGSTHARLGIASLTLGCLLPLLRTLRRMRQTIFHRDEDDKAFIRVLAEGFAEYVGEISN